MRLVGDFFELLRFFLRFGDARGGCARHHYLYTHSLCGTTSAEVFISLSVSLSPSLKVWLKMYQMKIEYSWNIYQWTMRFLSWKRNDKECNDVLFIIENLNNKTYKEYNDFYLNIDVYGLADVFENFRKTTLEYYKLEPCNYVGASSLAWVAMLLMNGVELDLSKDSDLSSLWARYSRRSIRYF